MGMVGSISGSRYSSAAATSLRHTTNTSSAVKAAASINMSGAAILGDSFVNMAYINGTSSETAVLDLFSSDSSTSTASLLDYTV
jgi:hypothetical protein